MIAFVLAVAATAVGMAPEEAAPPPVSETAPTPIGEPPTARSPTEPAPPVAEAPTPPEDGATAEAPEPKLGDPFRESAQDAPSAGEKPPTEQAKPVKSTPTAGPAQRPLPAPPPPVDPRTIETLPWRGKGWFDVRVSFVIPVGGERPGKANATSGAGGFAFGFRPHPYVGIYTGLSTWIHDVDSQTGVDENGEDVEVTAFGRLVAFDLASVRAYAPVRGRFVPFADVGAGIATYRAPFADRTRAAGLVKTGVGLNIWVGTTFTLSFLVDYRLVAIKRTFGHAIATGFGAGVHW